MKQQINEVVKDYSNKRKQKIVFGVVSVILSCIVCALTVYLFAGSAITESVNPTDDLNLINNTILGNSIDNGMLSNSIDNSILSNSIDNNVLSNSIDNTVSSNLIDNTVLSNAIDTSVSGLTSEASVTSSNSKGPLLTSVGPTSKTGASATTIGDASTAVSSIDSLEGITFELFNYDGLNTEIGVPGDPTSVNSVNNNGAYEYFAFVNSLENIETVKINNVTDEDGFFANHATVLPNLDANGYPVFDARTGNASDNFSLGYLFGSPTNARKSGDNATKGVTKYTPTNTLLRKENVSGVDYYYYDSSINAVDYDTANNRFIVRNYTERNSAFTRFANAATRSEFLPFTYRTSTDVITDPTTGITYNFENSETDFWFGMTIGANFYMPKDGLIEQQPMQFSFSGDDDVYVFIDNVLVLDIGGTHGAVDGTINFATGAVETYINWNGEDGRTEVPVAGKNKRHYTTSIYQSFVDAGAENTKEWTELANGEKVFADYSSHTIKFFYLERGGWVSNCKIRFNMPILPPGELNVKKEVTGLTSDIAESYQFKISDVTQGTASVLGNYPFTIGGRSFSTDENGIFTLSKDETAKFQVKINNKYRVEEVNSGENFEPFSCTLNGTACSNKNKTDDITIRNTTPQNVVFTNKRITYDITVKKDVIDDDATAEFDFTFVLKNNIGNIIMPMYEPVADDGYSLNSTTGEITFDLKDNESVILKGIPRSVTAILQEVTHDGYNVLIKEGDMVLSEGDIYKFITNKNINITVENIPDVRLPETGSSSELIMLLAGIVLMIVPFVYKYVYLRNKKG